jgi:hypothetical protein
VTGGGGGAGQGQGGVGTSGGTGDQGGEGDGDGSGVGESTIAAPVLQLINGEQVVVPGQSGAGPSETVGRGNAPTRVGSSRVPLRNALPAYRVEASRALNRLELSPSVRSLVRAYFDSFEEGR